MEHGEHVRRARFTDTLLLWVGALLCLGGVGLTFGVSGSIGIAVGAAGAAAVAVAVVARRT